MHPTVKCGVNQNPPHNGAAIVFATLNAVHFCVQMQAAVARQKTYSLGGSINVATEVAAPSDPLALCALLLPLHDALRLLCARPLSCRQIRTCRCMQASEDGKAAHAMAGPRLVDHDPLSSAQVHASNMVENHLALSCAVSTNIRHIRLRVLYCTNANNLQCNSIRAASVCAAAPARCSPRDDASDCKPAAWGQTCSCCGDGCCQTFITQHTGQSTDGLPISIGLAPVPCG